jgi:hypothetical protein
MTNLVGPIQFIERLDGGASTLKVAGAVAKAKASQGKFAVGDWVHIRAEYGDEGILIVKSVKQIDGINLTPKTFQEK